MGRQPCAAISAAHREPLLAKAGSGRAWVLVEHCGPWGRDPLADGSMDPAIAGPLAARAHRLGIRVVLIRRHGRQAVRGTSCYLAWTATDPPWVERCTMAHPAQVLEADLEALAAGRRPHFGEPVHQPFYLVCTHGNKDPCCAQFGRPTVAALTAALGEPVWECTHVGGDRFAANLVCFPHGLYFGRVGPPDAVRVAGRYAAGEIDLDHYRGRSGRHAAVQAADWYVRRSTGLVGIGDVVAGWHRTLPGGLEEVGLRTPRHRYRVQVRLQPHGQPRPVGCGNGRVWRPLAYVLVDLARQERPPTEPSVEPPQSEGSASCRPAPRAARSAAAAETDDRQRQRPERPDEYSFGRSPRSAEWNMPPAAERPGR